MLFFYILVLSFNIIYSIIQTLTDGSRETLTVKMKSRTKIRWIVLHMLEKLVFNPNLFFMITVGTKKFM